MVPRDVPGDDVLDDLEQFLGLAEHEPSVIEGDVDHHDASLRVEIDDLAAIVAPVGEASSVR